MVQCSVALAKAIDQIAAIAQVPNRRRAYFAKDVRGLVSFIWDCDRKHESEALALSEAWRRWIDDRLMRLGWSILEVNAKGHPDIRARVGDHEALIQVKTLHHRSANALIELSSDDALGVLAIGRRVGWFAVLDCAVPVQWLMIGRKRAMRLIAAPMRLATLRANCDLEFSNECNEHFRQIVSENQARLGNLSYTVLRNRALAHNGL